MKSRGHWPLGKRRNDVNGAEMMSKLCNQFSAAEIARIAGVSSRTVRRWANGEDWCRLEVINQIIDRLFPLNRSSGPIYDPLMAIDANTRVGGVGEYTRRSAQWRNLHEMDS